MKTMLIIVATLTACTAHSEPCETPPDAPPACDPADSMEVTCDTTIHCGDGRILHYASGQCSPIGADPAQDLEWQAQDEAENSGVCTAGGLYKARCTVPPETYNCPQAFDLADTTACVYAEPYDSPDIASVCSHLPVNDGTQPPACSVACDPIAMQQFAVDRFTVYTCESTNGFLFFAGARVIP